MPKLTDSQGKHYPIIYLDIQERLNGLDVATIHIAKYPIELNQAAVISHKVGGVDTAIFPGEVTASSETETNGIYEIVLTEHAVELQTVYAGTAPEYKLTFNVATPLDTAIALMLANTTWTNGSVGKAGDIKIDPCQYLYMDVFDGLYDLIATKSGFQVWFDHDTNVVYYGNARPAAKIVVEKYLSLKPQDTSMHRNIAHVVVIDSSGAQSGEAGSGDPTLVFQYTGGTVTVDQLKAMAQILQIQYGAPDSRMTMTTVPRYDIHPGDTVTVGGEDFLVQDVEIQLVNCKIGLDSPKVTLMSLLGNSLQIVSGTVNSAQSTTWDSGVINVGGPCDKYPGVYGPETQIPLTVGDPSNILKPIKLKVKIDKYTAQSVQSNSDVTNQLLSEVSVIATQGSCNNTNNLPQILPTDEMGVYFPNNQYYMNENPGNPSFFLRSEPIPYGFQYASVTCNLLAYYPFFDIPYLALHRYPYWIQLLAQIEWCIAKVGATKNWNKLFTNDSNQPEHQVISQIEVGWQSTCIGYIDPDNLLNSMTPVTTSASTQIIYTISNGLVTQSSPSSPYGFVLINPTYVQNVAWYSGMFPVCLTVLLPGDPSDGDENDPNYLYVRWSLGCDPKYERSLSVTAHLQVVTSGFYLQLIPRHTHDLVQINPKTNIPNDTNKIQAMQTDTAGPSDDSAPDNIEYKINNGVWTQLASGIETPDIWDQITSGDNILYVRAIRPCSVDFTATYNNFGGQ